MVCIMEPGQLIGPYRLENLIAEGGMGSVWRARHPTLDRLVAIKFVKTEVRDNTHARDAFMREVRHLSRLHGPQIVHVLDFGFTDEGDPYMVTEFLEGEDLLSRLRTNRRLSVREAVFIGIEVLKALGEAHALGLIHRDLKPGNIFLQRLAGGARMAVKVLDFGVAKLLVSEEGEGTLWPDGSPKGSPRYMAPEQVLNEPVTPASDMYAFGATLYRALSGEPVFGGSVHVMMRGHLEGNVESLRTRFPDLGIPPELDDIILGCLAKSSADRPGSADALQARLEKLLQTLPMTGSTPVQVGDYSVDEVSRSPNSAVGSPRLSSGEQFPGWLEPSLAPTGEGSLASGPDDGQMASGSDSGSDSGVGWGTASTDDAESLQLAFSPKDASHGSSPGIEPAQAAPPTPGPPQRRPRPPVGVPSATIATSPTIRPEHLVAVTVLVLGAAWYFSSRDGSAPAAESLDAEVAYTYDVGRKRVVWPRRDDREITPAVVRTGTAPEGRIDAGAAASVRVRVVPGPASFKEVKTGVVICKDVLTCVVPIDIDVRIDQAGYRTKILSGDDLYDRRNHTWRVVLQTR